VTQLHRKSSASCAFLFASSRKKEPQNTRAGRILAANQRETGTMSAPMTDDSTSLLHDCPDVDALAEVEKAYRRGFYQGAAIQKTSTENATTMPRDVTPRRGIP
jgi:hypothetical protein